jgi:hypothetical protein
MMIEIRIIGHLSVTWSEWLDGLSVVNEENGEAVITGQLPDQTALLGLFNRIHALNLVIISYRQIQNGVDL